MVLVGIGQSQIPSNSSEAKSDIEYIRLGNETMVRFKTIDLTDDPGTGLDVAMLWLQLTYSIRPAIVPKAATINILASSLNGYQFDRGHELTLTIDGRSVALGEMAADMHKGEKITGTQQMAYHEALILIIPYESFAPLLQAKNANIRFGKTKFGLSGSTRKKLKEYAAQITDEGLTQ